MAQAKTGRGNQTGSCTRAALVARHPDAEPDAEAILEGQQRRRAEDQPRHQGLEHALAGQHQQDRAEEAPEGGREQQAAGPGLLAFELGALGQRAAEVAGAERDGVGDVGRHRRHAEGGQRREGDEGAAAGDGVHRAPPPPRRRRSTTRPPLSPISPSPISPSSIRPAPTSRQRRRSSPARRRAGRGSGRCSRRATYSATLARASSAVPEAVSICTISSGTSFDAASTCSWVAGQVSTSPTRSSSDCGHARRLHDVGLLAEVLRHHQPGHVERGVAVLVHRAHDELRPVDVVERPAGLGRPVAEVLHGACGCSRARRGS